MNTSRPTQNCPTLFRSLGVAGLLLISLTASLFSQGASIAPSDQQNQPQNVTQTLSPESLQQLLAPIALYPDALISLILPASTVPSDVVLASRYIAANGDPQNIPNQSWDGSVQSLASYPEVITWMDQNLQWTTTLGEAFIAQQADVMSAIQQLRSQAQVAGNLVDTPQQRVVKENTVIRIVPAEQDYLYVPQYDPEVVYAQPYSQDIGPLVTFGVGLAVGAWLNYDCDWNHHQIYRGDWQPGWNGGGYQNGGNPGGNNVNVVNINQSTAQPWQPSPQNSQQLVRQQQNFSRINSSIPANPQAGSGVNPASARTHPGQINSGIPRPSRANFANGSAARNNPGASPGRPATTMPQAAQVNRSAFQPTKPPKVLGQNGKPLANYNAENPNQSVKKHSANHAPSAQMPPAPVPAPVVGQNGGSPATALQQSANAKHHNAVSTPDAAPQQRPQQQPASAGQAQGHKSAPAPAPQEQSQQSSPANNPRPQQVAEVSKHHTAVSTPAAAPKQQRPQQQPASAGQAQVHKSAPAQVPQVQSQRSSPANNPRPQQVPEAPKRHTAVSTPAAAPQQQRPQQPAPAGQPQVHKSAPPAQISKAPAANPAQSQPSGKTPGKKKKDETPVQ